MYKLLVTDNKGEFTTNGTYVFVKDISDINSYEEGKSITIQ